MTATPCPLLTPIGCAWRTQRPSQRLASCRPPSLMDMTTVMLAGCLTRLYGEVFNSACFSTLHYSIRFKSWSNSQEHTLNCHYGYYCDTTQCVWYWQQNYSANVCSKGQPQSSMHTEEKKQWRRRLISLLVRVGMSTSKTWLPMRYGSYEHNYVLLLQWWKLFL